MPPPAEGQPYPHRSPSLAREMLLAQPAIRARMEAEMARKEAEAEKKQLAAEAEAEKLKLQLEIERLRNHVRA